MTHDPFRDLPATPEQRLVAALLRASMIAARDGDPDATDWLVNCSTGWLPLVTPAGASPDAIHRRLLIAAEIGETS